MKAAAERTTDAPEAATAVRARAERPEPAAAVPGRRQPMDVRALQRLQSRAGNAAVARMVAQRTAAAGPGGPGSAAAKTSTKTSTKTSAKAEPSAGGGSAASAVSAAPSVSALDAGPALALQRLDAGGSSLPVAPPGLTAAQDSRFRTVTGKVAKDRASLTKHPSGPAAAKAAQDAAVAPSDDKEAQAKAAQVGEMGTAKAAPFDKAAFIAAVNKAVAGAAPKNLDEADKFATSGKADAVKGQVQGQVAAGREGSAKDIAAKTAAPPDPSRAEEKVVTPLPPQPGPATPGAPDPAAASVAPAPAEQTDLSEGPKRTDAAMSDAKLTPEQLTNANEPQFTEALGAKQAADAHAATAPAQYRTAEAARVAAEKSGAAATGAAGVQQLAAAHAGGTQRAATGQGAAKSQDEQARAAVTAEVKSVFDATKTDTERILTTLDTEVDTAFESGQQRAKDAFTAEHTSRMEAYKDARYSGLEGAAQWLADLVMDLPPEANDIFVQAKQVYEREMQKVVADIADVIGRRLGEATQRIATGRAAVTAIVDRQKPELRQFAQQAATDIGGEFDQLDSSIAEKSQSMVQDLADRYAAARNELDEEIKTLQAENKGLLSKAEDAIAETAKTVLQLKDMLLGVLARAAGAIDKIITDPIGFLGNLVNAVKAGVTGFATRIGDHLKTGLKEWLFGQLSSAGIEIPDEFDAKGVIKLLLSVLGLTWPQVRGRIVKVIGEPAMAGLESTFDMVKILVTEGIGGLWKWIVEKLADLKDTVIGAIEDFITEKIVTAGITWVVSLLNPASAFVRACKAIYDVVMFFVNRAAQIKSFVDSVLDSVESIASGGGGGVPAMIENALAKAVPVVLDFLASLLGLGGISEKIRSVLAKVQAPVMKVVDWVIGKIVAAGKKLLAKFGKKKDGSAADGKDGAAADGEKGPIHEPFDLDGQSHEIYDGPSGGLIVASEKPQPVDHYAQLQALDANYKALDSKAKRSDRKRIIAAMIALIRNNPGLKALLNGGGKIGDPPNLGEIKPHGSQTARFQPPPGQESFAKLWELESEHVIPRSYVDSLLKSRGQTVTNETEYRRMHTVLIYKGAADLKTDGPPPDLGAPPGKYGSGRDKSHDQHLLRGLSKSVERGLAKRKAQAEGAPTGGRVNAGDTPEYAQRVYDRLKGGAIKRTEQSVLTDFQNHKDKRGEAARPDSSVIASAAAQQQTDIDAILASRPPVPQNTGAGQQDSE